jgi:hypothetical protein
MDGASTDLSCLNNPAGVTTSNPVVKCPYKYCTIIRQEYVDPAGKWWGSLTCREISQHEIHVFTFPPREIVLWIFIALKNPSSSSGFEPANLGPNGRHATTRASRATVNACKLLLWRFKMCTVPSPVSIVSDCRLDERGSIPGRREGFFL